jgi:chromosome segregation ATPase
MKDVQVIASLQNVESKLEQYKSEYESINHSINVFKNQINELHKKPDVPLEFGSFKSTTELLIKELSNNQYSNKLSIDSIKTDITSLRRAIEIHEDRIRTAERHLPILERGVSEAKEALNQKIETVSNGFALRFTEHADKQKSQLESFRAEAFSAPKSVIESNNRILEKLEVATLDASNSMLKVNNFDLNLKLLERKLEQLTLQVKKLELSQKA